jgi:hypothetical protein
VTFAVTQNLHAALKRLRLQHQSRLLWVDAICINQDDTSEKSFQVAMMSEIYSKTIKGLLWLGEEPQIPVQTVSPEQSLAVDRVLKDADEVIAKLSKDMMATLLPSDPEFDTWKSWSVLPPPAPDHSLTDAFRITRTAPCVWHNDDSDIATLNLSAAASMEDDAVFHAFCLFRLLSAGHHLKDIPYFQLEEEGQETYRTFGRRAAHWICTRDWWGRIWTVQECVLPDDCTVIYGPVTAPWSMFLDAIANFQHHRSSCCAGIHTAVEIYDMLNYQVDTILELRAIRDQRRRGEEILLGELVRQFRYRQATDPRDKLYALIPVVTSWNGQPPLEPHYEKSFAPIDTFRQGVIKAIEVSGTLDILCQLETPVSKANTPPPSWIPDFAQQAAHPGTLDHFMKQIHLYNACGGVMATPKVAADSVLVLEGYYVDALKRASTMMVDIKHQDRMETLSWWHHVAEEECSKANEGWRRSFWRTICGDSILRERVNFADGGVPVPSELRRVSESDEAVLNQWCAAHRLNHLQTTIDAEDDTEFPNIISKPVGAIHYAISVTTRDKRFIVSTKGRMGVAPKMALVTIPTPDEIFILAGGKTPFVLRPAGSRDVPGTGMQPCYTLIGDCYLEGIMDGEAMAEYSANKKPVYLV